MKISSRLIVATGTLTAILWLILSIFQANELRKLQMSALQSNRRQTIPPLQESIRPTQVATNKALKILRGNGKLDKQMLPTILQKLKNLFGNQIRLTLWDHKIQDSVFTGFTEEWAENLRMFMIEYRRILRNSSGRNNQRHFFSHFVDFDLRMVHLPNHINTTEIRFEKQNGLLITGLLFDSTPDKNMAEEITGTVNVQAFDHQLCGAVILFIPAEIYRNIDWLSKNAIFNESHSPVFGTHSEIISSLNNHSEGAAAQFSAITEHSMNGAFISGNKAFTFCQTELNTQTAPTEPYFAIYSTDVNFSSFVFHKLFSIVGTILCLIAMFYLVSMQNLASSDGPSSLSRHLIILSSLACLVPFVELARQSVNHGLTQKMLQDRKAYDALDRSLEEIERSYKREMGEIISSIADFQNLYQDHIDDAGIIPANKLAELERQHITQIFVGNPDGKIRYIDTKTEGALSERRQAGAELLKLLAQYIQTSTGFSEQRLSDADSLKIESFTDAMGVEPLFNMAMARKKLLPFQFAHGEAWFYSDIQEYAALAAKRFFLYLITRIDTQSKIIEKWQKGLDPTQPRFVFMNQNYQVVEKLAPGWAEDHPNLTMLLKNINTAGGTISTRISSNKREFYVLGRQLRGMTWIALAVKEAEGTAYSVSNNLLLLLLMILYLPIPAIFISKLFASFFVAPVKAMTNGVIAMADGDYDLRVEHHSNDELGKLCQSFNSMASQLKEKEFLERFLSEIAKDAISGKIETRATRIEGTVLFSDIRAFTTLTETHPPEEIVTMLNDYMTRMEEAIEAHGGSIEKFIGDAIMAVFLPIHGQPNPAARALKASKAMSIAVKHFNRHRIESGKFEIENGMGIATGQLLMGSLGNLEGRRDFTVTGAIVLVAADMEKVTKQVTNKNFKIAVCPKTAQILAQEGHIFTAISNAEAIEAYEIQPLKT